MDIKKSKINSISAYLQTMDTPLGKIIQRAQHIHTLQNDLKLELGSEFCDRFWVGSYENGFLTLLVDSASLATKLRFSVPDIRENLRKQSAWFGLKSIHVKILVTRPVS